MKNLKVSGYCLNEIICTFEILLGHFWFACSFKSLKPNACQTWHDCSYNTFKIKSVRQLSYAKSFVSGKK